MIALDLIFAAASTLTPPACVPVETGQVQARHVAAVVKEFAALPPERVLGAAPRPGARRVFTPRDLERLASVNGLRLNRPAEVCVEWPVAPVARERVLAAMKQTLQDPAVHVEIVDLSRQPAPQGQVVFPRAGLSDPPPSQTKATVFWRGYVEYGGKKRFDVWARVRLWLSTTRLVAKVPLRPGEPVRADQIRCEPWEDFPYGAWLLRHPAQAVGRVPSRPVREGAYLDASLLTEPKQILKGDLIRVEVRTGAARISTEAVAESDARIGETVYVRNRVTGKKFAAHARQRGLAEVVLAGAAAN